MDAKALEELASVVDRLLASETTTPKVGASDGEPVVLSQLVTTLLAAIVSVGWIALPVPVINIVGTVVALAVMIGTTLHARSKVTPVVSWNAQIDQYVTDLVRREMDAHHSRLARSLGRH